MKKVILLFALLLLVGCRGKMEENNSDTICVECFKNEFPIIHSTSSCQQIRNGIRVLFEEQEELKEFPNMDETTFCSKCTDEEWRRQFWTDKKEFDKSRNGTIQ